MGSPLGPKYILYPYMAVSKMGGPQHIVVFIMGTPKKVPLVLGNPHMHLLGMQSVLNMHPASSQKVQRMPAKLTPSFSKLL